LTRSSSSEFVFGEYASVHSVLQKILKSSRPVTISERVCPQNHFLHERVTSYNGCDIVTHADAETSLQNYVNNFNVALGVACDSTLLPRTTFVQLPPLLAFDLGRNVPKLPATLRITTSNDQSSYVLKGVVYYAHNHFTCRVITNSGMIWFHDGIFTGRNLVPEGSGLENLPSDNAIVAVYLHR